MGVLAPPPEIGERRPPDADKGAVPWEGMGLVLAILAAVAFWVGASGEVLAASVVGVVLVVVALVLVSPSLREQVPGLRPGWRLLARGYGLEVVSAGPSWQVRGEVAGVPLTVRVEAEGSKEFTVVDSPLPPLDLAVRLATDRDPPDALGRRWMPELVVTGRDAELLVLLDEGQRKQLVRDLRGGLVIEDGCARQRWPRAHHEVDSLRFGLIAGPVWFGGWLRRVGATRLERLLEATGRAEETELARLLAVLSLWDPGHPVVGEVGERLRASTSALARLVAGVVLEDPTLSFPTVGARSVPPPWQRWALQRLLASDHVSVAERARGMAVTQGSPTLLWELSDAGRLDAEDFALLARRWPQLDAASWDCEAGHQLLSGTVDMLEQAGTLGELLDGLPASPAFVRRTVAEAVARFERPETTARLAVLREDPDPEIAALARRAIASLSIDEDVLDALRAGGRLRAALGEAAADTTEETDEADEEPTVERTVSRFAREPSVTSAEGPWVGEPTEQADPDDERTVPETPPVVEPAPGPVDRTAPVNRATDEVVRQIWAAEEQSAFGALPTHPSIGFEGRPTPALLAGAYNDEGVDPHLHLLPVLEEEEGWGDDHLSLDLLDQEERTEATAVPFGREDDEDLFSEDSAMLLTERVRHPALDFEDEPAVDAIEAPAPVEEADEPAARPRRSLLGLQRRG
jgi:hypothetical protein